MSARPRKKRQDRAWRRVRVAEVEVIRPGIVEIDRAFDQREAEHFQIKVQAVLRVGRDGRDVMKAE
jgi:hypothetical protein